MSVKKCEVCGKEFVPNKYTPWQKYCCVLCNSKKSGQKKTAKSKKQRKEETKEIAEPISKPTVHLILSKSLNQLAREAAEHHMTYGKYIVMLEEANDELQRKKSEVGGVPQNSGGN